MDNEALFKIGYGLYVLTSSLNGRDNGCIVNTFIQLSSSPLRVGVSVSKENLTCSMIAASGIFNVSVLASADSCGYIQASGFRLLPKFLMLIQ